MGPMPSLSLSRNVTGEEDSDQYLSRLDAGDAPGFMEGMRGYCGAAVARRAGALRAGEMLNLGIDLHSAVSSASSPLPRCVFE